MSVTSKMFRFAHNGDGGDVAGDIIREYCADTARGLVDVSRHGIRHNFVV